MFSPSVLSGPGEPCKGTPKYRTNDQRARKLLKEKLKLINYNV